MEKGLVLGWGGRHAAGGKGTFSFQSTYWCFTTLLQQGKQKKRNPSLRGHVIQPDLTVSNGGDASRSPGSA